jgi:hypothetical protein
MRSHRVPNCCGHLVLTLGQLDSQIADKTNKREQIWLALRFGTVNDEAQSETEERAWGPFTIEIFTFEASSFRCVTPAACATSMAPISWRAISARSSIPTDVRVARAVRRDKDRATPRASRAGFRSAGIVRGR